MSLTKLEREAITDSMLKIQSIRDSLNEVGESKIPKVDEIECCLDNADHQLKIALGYAQAEAPSGEIQSVHRRKHSAS